MNWPLVVVLSVFGLGGIVGALMLDDWSNEAWSSVLIEGGAALALLSALVLLEQRLVRDVAVSTARTEVERATADLRGRVQRLEELDAAQQAHLEARHRAADEQLESIRRGDISQETVGALLVEGVRDRLFDPDLFHVRTSHDPNCPKLYVLPFVDPSRVVFVFFDVEPMRLSPEPAYVDGERVPVPIKTDSTVLWMDEDPAEIGAQLVAGLDRRNTPRHGFGFGFAIEQLLRSIEVMRAARSAPADDPRRLKGRLRLLVNDEWAYTSAGLEAVSSATLFQIRAAGFNERGQWLGSYLYLADDDRAAADPRLREALDWLEERESVRILTPGTDPAADMFGRMAKRKAD